MKRRKRMGDSIERCGTPLLIGLEKNKSPCTTPGVEEYDGNRGIDVVGGWFTKENFLPDFFNGFQDV